MSNNAGSFNYSVGIGHVGSFQVSGHPFITGSTAIDMAAVHTITFPRVAKKVVVTSRSNEDLQIYFTHPFTGDATAKHYVTLVDNKDSFTFNVKCKEMYIMSLGNGGAYELYAELTGIETKEMYHLTGSGLTDLDTVND
tara:strand:+ start:11757 stop:12173 length:417 start_codon:yes stop_codon:yes gene_type:complete